MERAVVFEETVQVVERARPVPEPGEALIQLRTGGICNTDLELMQGYKNFRGVLGHEFVGTVIDGPAEWVRQRVVGDINVSCGECDRCQRGMPTHCRVRRTLGLYNYDGAFADVFRLPVANLFRVPDQVPDDAAVFTEPLAAACRILDDVQVRPTDRVVVLGAGKLGLLVAQVLQLTGAELMVVARRERPRRLLADWGIPTITTHEGLDSDADVVVDCTGSVDGLAAALKIVRPRGTLVLKSTTHDKPQVDLTRIAVNEIHVVGSRCGPFAAALRLLEQRLVQVTPMIEAVYALEDAPAALEFAAQPGTLKVLLKP